MNRLLSAVLALGLGFTLATSHAADVTFKLGHGVFETHPYHDAAVRFKEAVEKASKGSIKIQIYPARQLGDVKELMEGVQLGTVDMTMNPTSAMATSVPAMDAFQLPGVIKDYRHFVKMAKSPQARIILDTLKPKGIIALGLYDGGQRHFLSTKKLVTKMEDFKGLKTRVAPARLFLDTWKAIGTNPTPMAYGEIYSALETGTLDAVEINLTSIESEKMYEVAKNVTLTGHYFFPAALYMNKAKFDALTPEQQQIMRTAANDIIEPQVMAIDALDKKLVTAFKAKGLKVVEADAKLEQGIKAAVKPVVDSYKEKDPYVAAFIKAAEESAK